MRETAPPLTPSGRLLTVRPMTTADLPHVMAIEVVACPTPFTETGYRKEIERNKLSHYHVLVIDQQTIVGYVGHWMMAGECHISTIAIAPDQQGQGYGELLLLYALLQSLDQAATLATLEVRDSNETAQRLYRKTGFETVGKRKKYYKDTGEDAAIMTLSPLQYDPLKQQWDALLLRLAPAQPV